MKKYQYLASWDDQTLTRVGEPVVVLGDSNVSQVEVILPSNFLLDPTKAECRMYFLLPGKKESDHDVLETATKDDNGDSHVTWTIKHVHSQKGGRLAFSLTLIGDDAQWDSRTAIIPIYESRYQPESEEAEEPYTGRLDALEGSMAAIRGEFTEVQDDFEELKETATLGTPIPESLVANMQEGHVYIYTGTEPGYTAGHVYYYVDGVLKDGGVYGGTAVDATLTVSGAAADAKVTGDKIAEIKEDLSSFIESEQFSLDWSNIGTATYPLGWRKGYYSGSTGAFSTSEHYISTIVDGSSTIKNLLRNTDKITVSPPAGYTLTITAFDTPYSSTSHNIVFRTETTARMDIAVNHDYYYVYTVGRFDDSAASYITDAFVNSIVVQYVEKNTNVSPLSTFNVGMFSKIGVCGYSWDAGYYYLPDGTAHTNRAKSWGAILARKWGIEYGSYTVPSGTSVKPDSAYTTISWQENANGLPALLADSPCDLYFMHMFGNDLSRLGTNYLGTIDDITEDYTDNPDTYYGNMGRIIERIKAYAPNALMVLSYNYYSLNGYDDYHRAILEIAEHYGLPVIDWYDDEWYATQMSKFLINNHPTIASYSAMAESAERLITDCIKQNWDYFKAFGA